MASMPPQVDCFEIEHPGRWIRAGKPPIQQGRQLCVEFTQRQVQPPRRLFRRHITRLDLIPNTRRRVHASTRLSS